MTLFSEQFDPKNIETLVQNSLNCSEKEVSTLTHKQQPTLNDLPTLLSPAIQTYLEPFAQAAQTLTQQRFGHTMQLFAPIYLSNECFNRCTYCGFSMDNKYPRVTLTDEQILKEGDLLKAKGFQHILLLTGEAPGKVDAPYIAHATKLLSPHFASIGIEVQPLKTEEYTQIITSGADSLTLYQETYHPDAYANYHLAGKKKNFKNRLDAIEAGGQAEFYRINIGALLGLHDWRYDCIALAHHLTYLQKKYWKSKFSVSFPRLKTAIGKGQTLHPVADIELVQAIIAFRLLFPDVGITLSTREPAELRNHLIQLGITTMSAESQTNPGGYAGEDSENQFDISDERSLEEIQALLTQKGFDPVLKDWD